MLGFGTESEPDAELVGCSTWSECGGDVVDGLVYDPTTLAVAGPDAQASDRLIMIINSFWGK